MNNNPHGLQIGDKVILDKDFVNGGEVVIDNFSPDKLYATVHEESYPEDKWQTMTYRLTPKNYESKAQS